MASVLVLESTDRQFETDRYIRANSLIEPTVVSTAYRYALMKSDTGAMLTDAQVPSAASLYGDTLMETLLEMTRPAVERITGLALLPTYSYFRIYRTGDILTAHTDRPSCEISATVTLGFRAPEPWPIYMANGALASSVALEPGDSVIYRGKELSHWRERFEGEHHVQLFLHYVDRDGPHADCIYDFRPALGHPPTGREQ